VVNGGYYNAKKVYLFADSLMLNNDLHYIEYQRNTKGNTKGTGLLTTLTNTY